MTLDLLQHIVVTIVAIGAAAVIVRRVTGLVRKDAPPKCDACPSAASHKPPATTAPLTLIRKR